VARKLQEAAGEDLEHGMGPVKEGLEKLLGIY
jgi:hypothetical protein